MTNFGIITPTYRRAKFLPAFIRNLQRQTHSDWRLMIVHDGPDDCDVAQVVRKSAGEDNRIIYLQTPVHHGNWGVGPRLFGLRKLAEFAPNLKYCLFWDDDNQFYRDAIAKVSTAIVKCGEPDLLLVPIRRKWRTLPLVEGSLLRAIPIRGIDMGNMCVRTETAIRHYAKIEKLTDFYLQDYYFYRSICDDNSTGVYLAAIDPIGRYDGLRFWEKLRWTIYPRPLNVHDTAPLRLLRRMLPRS